MSLHCRYFLAGECRSCSELLTPYARQLADKDAAIRAQFADWPDIDWLPPVASAPSGFRNKAKMAVGGSIGQPTLGLSDADGREVDLSDCLLYPPALQAAFAPIKSFIRRAGIAPYDIRARRGELKFALLTLAEHSGELMLRLVLRSPAALGRIRRALPDLIEALPALKVVSANLQPLPAAVLEGEEEILLTAQTHLLMRVNDIDLYLRPQGFFQTNTQIAAALYRQAAKWVAQADPASVWDLYCGVGGFALHCADGRREVLGVELSEAAVEAARQAARARGVAGLRFEARDAAGLHLPARGAPELLIVNPPRRGIGDELCAQIEASDVRQLIYSSCNAQSLARDLRALPSFRPLQGRVMDMFAHTRHAETLLRLERPTPVRGDAGSNA